MSLFKKALIISIVTLSFINAQPYGLTERIPNESLLIGTTDAATKIELKQIYKNVQFNLPILLTNANDNSNRIFVVQQGGIIVVLPGDPLAAEAKTFLDLTDFVFASGERGLLSLAFHPNYSENGKLYVSYTVASTISYIAEYIISGNPDSVDTESARIILSLPQPASNHNGGHIAFGSDGYLYIAFGDGGGTGDPFDNGQDINTLFGSILRIDIDQTEDGLEYAIPIDNPFYGIDSTRAEIWAYGLRNPWRFSFDRETYTLWCGDVGQGKWEEVDIINKGKNYGWNLMEGFNCFPPGSVCDSSGLTLPIVEYNHSEGISITGGYVYRGSEISNWQGTYIYGDYASRTIWDLVYLNGEVIKNDIIAQSPSAISSFGEDEQGELYVVGYGGSIFKIIEKADTTASDSIPSSISKSGLYSDIENKVIAPGIIKYDLNNSLWSDGALKDRYMALPGTTQVTFSEDGFWNFPNRTVLVKNFMLELEEGNPLSRKLIETRFFIKQTQGESWDGFSYMWNEDETDATLLNGNAKKQFTINGINGPYEYEYYFPSRAECLQCHTAAAGYVLGPKTAQLNRGFLFENGVTDNQLRSYNHIDLFSNDIGEDYSGFPKMVSLNDSIASLEEKARSYLDANCANCHRPAGIGISELNLSIDTALEQANLINEPPLRGDLGISGASLLTPGEPDSSILYLRMRDLTAFRMPPLASSVIDTKASSIIKDWILSLKPTAISDEGILPASFKIKAYPNPFNPITTIEYQIPDNAEVSIKLFDLNGRLIKSLVNESKNAGTYFLKLDISEISNKNISSGLYFYKIRALTKTQLFQETKKLIILK